MAGSEKVCGGKSGLQSTVDGLSQPDGMANLFAPKYEDLYSCVGYETEITSLKRDINDKIMQGGHDVHCIVTAKDVIDAVSRLKPGKYDGCMGCIRSRQTCMRPVVHISMLLTTLTVHGIITDDLSMSTICLLPRVRA